MLLGDCCFCFGNEVKNMLKYYDKLKELIDYFEESDYEVE